MGSMFLMKSIPKEVYESKGLVINTSTKVYLTSEFIVQFHNKFLHNSCIFSIVEFIDDAATLLAKLMERGGEPIS